MSKLFEIKQNVNDTTPVSIIGMDVRVDLVNIGEGYNGDYDPDNPEDEELLRFDVYFKYEDQWEPLESDGSACTMLQADLSAKKLIRAVVHIWTSYHAVYRCRTDETSFKRLCEYCSYLNGDDFTEEI